MNDITDDIKASYGILENAKHAKHEHTCDILLAAAKKLNPSLDIATYKAQWLDRWMKNKKKEHSMSTSESNPLPPESIIAYCNICLLSEVMKACPSCPLNPGNLSLTDDQRAKVDRKELLKPAKEL